MKDIQDLAWRVFRSAFKDGEQVIVEGRWGDFYWGKLRADDEGLTLTRPDGRSQFLDWEDVEFICHDGFPVRKLIHMTAKEAAMRATREPADIVQELLLSSPFTRRIGGGCPFVAGPLSLAAVHNRGNVGPAWDERCDIETLVFAAADGAQMHSYDSEHLFLDL